VDARAVIDASGTWAEPNPAGADGLPALGEARRRRGRDLPLAEPERSRPRPSCMPGAMWSWSAAGHSALTAVHELGQLARTSPGTRISWVLRRAPGPTFGGGAADQLPERGALGIRAREPSTQDWSPWSPGSESNGYVAPDGVVLVSEDGRSLAPAARVVVLTGFRPDLSFLSEMRLELDATLQAPVRLATEIDPNLHSCGDVAATGAKDLAHPERDLYLVGMKSYGRAPTFLAMTGYEQIRSVVAELAGDYEAAARVELSLPDTGVCGGAGLFDDP
jgi:hypothetical protein